MQELCFTMPFYLIKLLTLMFTGSNTVNVDKVYRFNHWDPPPIGRLKWKLTRPKY